MSIENFPIVRLTIDHMRHQIVSGFSGYIDGLKETVEHEVDAAVKAFDFESEIRRMSAGLLHQAINDSLKQAFSTLAWDAAMRKALAQVLLDKVGPNDAIRALRGLAVPVSEDGRKRWCFCKSKGFSHTEECDAACDILTVSDGPPGMTK
jgi:hypothetical protein